MNESDEVAANTSIATTSRNEEFVHASIAGPSTSQNVTATRAVDVKAIMEKLKKTEFDEIFDDLTDVLSRLRLAGNKVGF